MSNTSRLFVRVFSAFLVVAPIAAAFAADPPATPASAARHKAHKKPAPAAFVLPPLPAGPLRQIPMDQLPATQPKVSYQNGLLTVSAHNATLAEILSDVQKLTGASVDIPAGGGNEHVVTQLGPGAPRDVLAQLLNGTSFNYVMVGTMTDPNSVVSVVLTPKPAGGEVQTAVNTPPPVWTPAVPGQLPPPGPLRQQMLAQVGPAPQQTTQVVTAEEDNSDDSEDEKDDTDADQNQQPAQPGMVMQTPDQGGDPNQPNAGPRTPEQILQMMRQNQPGNNPNGPGPLNTPPPPHE